MQLLFVCVCVRVCVVTLSSVCFCVFVCGSVYLPVSRYMKLCVCVTGQSRNSIEFIVQGAFMRVIHEICFLLSNNRGEKLKMKNRTTLQF